MILKTPTQPKLIQEWIPKRIQTLTANHLQNAFSCFAEMEEASRRVKRRDLEVFLRMDETTKRVAVEIDAHLVGRHIR